MEKQVEVTAVKLQQLALWVVDSTLARGEFVNIANEIIEVIVKKNHDYGNAWQKYGIFTPLIRLNDKLLRVKTLVGGIKAMVADESVKDTMRDIVAYGLLALLRIEWEEQQNTMPTPATREEALLQQIAKADNDARIYRDKIRWRTDENGKQFIFTVDVE
jgi:hypothetical protein